MYNYTRTCTVLERERLQQLRDTATSRVRAVVPSTTVPLRESCFSLTATMWSLSPPQGLAILLLTLLSATPLDAAAGKVRGHRRADGDETATTRPTRPMATTKNTSGGDTPATTITATTATTATVRQNAHACYDANDWNLIDGKTGGGGHVILHKYPVRSFGCLAALAQEGP